MAARCSRDPLEIGLFLDTATAKRPVHNLVGKLGVETRLAAPLKAKEVLGLARN